MNRRVKKWAWGTVIAVTVVVAGVAGYSAWQVCKTAGRMYQPVERLPSAVRHAPPAAPASPDAGNASAKSSAPVATNAPTQTYLLLGIDRRPDTADIGRTDVILLAIVNDRTDRITLLSIPRDTYVEIAGHGYKDKINAAYQYGVATTISTVENFTGLPVDHYALFNFQGFEKAVDALGGVRVPVDQAVAGQLHLPAGEHLLTGEQALSFARFRHDNNGDFGRNDRQQVVFKAFLDQSSQVRSPAKIQEFLNVAGEDVRTDVTLPQMTSLAAELNRFTSHEVEQLKYKAGTANFGPQQLSYVVIDEGERARMSELLKERAQ